MKQYYYQRKEVNYKMAQIDLTKYGITGTTEIVYNPLMSSYLRKRQNQSWKAMKKAGRQSLVQLTL